MRQVSVCDAYFVKSESSVTRTVEVAGARVGYATGLGAALDVWSVHGLRDAASAKLFLRPTHKRAVALPVNFAHLHDDYSPTNPTTSISQQQWPGQL